MKEKHINIMAYKDKENNVDEYIVVAKKGKMK
jgi:hypothetical protein